MTLADYSLTAFALLNGARVLAYLPQMIRIYRDPNGAAAVSVTTWSLITAANVATISYALTVSHDRVVAGVFGLNAVGCLIIVALTAFKRLRFRHNGPILMQFAPAQRRAYRVAERADAASEAA